MRGTPPARLDPILVRRLGAADEVADVVVMLANNAKSPVRRATSTMADI